MENKDLRAPDLSWLEASPSRVFRDGMEAVLNVLPDPVFAKDRSHRWVIVNDAFCQFIGQPREWLYGKSDYDYAELANSPLAEADNFWAKDDEVFTSGEPNISLEFHTDSAGRRRAIETKKTLLRDPQGQVFLIGVIRDLSELTQAKADLEELNRALERNIDVRTRELRESNAQLEHLAYFDPLTGLPNRRHLLRSLNHLLPSQNVAVFYVDLDHFKWMNDSKGHPFGDEILIAVAERFGGLARFSLMSRIGGDEFIAISEIRSPASEQQLSELARCLLEALVEPVTIQGQQIVMGASIGIAVSPRDGLRATELIQRADTALYRAKNLGGRQFAFFNTEMGSHAVEHAALETGLRAVIKAHRLGVALQSIVDSRSRQPVGFEALARWHDLTLGDVLPDRFIPIAESAGLIYELGLSVMEQAFRLFRRYMHIHAFSKRARLAINLSARQLAHPSFLVDLRRLLEQTAFPPHQLEFEITESSAMSFSTETLANLSGLRQMNIEIALDDFGTGFSSLTLLQRLPIDRIKIDRGFVADLPHNQRTAALVGAMVSMAHALNLKVVAEGVERSDQAAFLTQLSCDELQGFLFGRPVLITPRPYSAADEIPTGKGSQTRHQKF